MQEYENKLKVYDAIKNSNHVIVYGNRQTGKTNILIDYVIEECLKKRNFIIHYYCQRPDDMKDRFKQVLMSRKIDFSNGDFIQLVINNCFVRFFYPTISKTCDLIVCDVEWPGESHFKFISDPLVKKIKTIRILSNEYREVLSFYEERGWKIVKIVDTHVSIDRIKPKHILQIDRNYNIILFNK